MVTGSGIRFKSLVFRTSIKFILKQYCIYFMYRDIHVCNMFQLMGPQFISSIKPHLADMWTPEHDAAWEQLFRLICHYMRRGMCSI